ncbi:MAG: hypothetical protein WCQ95_13440 [Bacteroidota bacterium]
MIKQFNKEINSAYFEEVYEFKGLWDVDSRCGLKLVHHTDKTVVIATELYVENPGTSVTNFSAQLASILCQHFNIPPDKLIFIVHDPEAKSKLTFMNEHFYRVDFEWDGTKFMYPKWSQIEKKIVDDLIC